MAEATMEKDAPLSSPLEIADPKLVPIFLDSPRRRLLLAFVDRTLSVSQAAARLGQPLGRVHYHVTRFARAGLLRVVRAEKRGGRPILHYRAAASGFFVPLTLLDRSPGAGMSAELRRSLDAHLFRSDEDGVLFFTQAGEPRVSYFGQTRASRTAGEFWHVLSLTPEAVSAFDAELRALMDKYERLSGGGRPYLLHAAFAPRPEAERGL